MTSINTNIGAMVAQKNMMDNTKDLDNAMARISSGLRINSASDDAAGSAIASKMESQVRSLGVAIRNANDAISLTQTAEGALGEVENILQRMRELSVQAGNSTLNTSDRSQIQGEMNQLASEIDSIASKTNFNNVSLLNGANAKVTMQIGISGSDSLDINLQTTTTSALGVGNSGSANSASVLTSGRITEITAVIAKGDVKINGQDWTATDFDTTATAVDGSDQNLSGTSALAVNELQAAAIAVKINENSGVHGVSARAFNELTTSTSYYSGGTVTINGIAITASGSKSEFVAKVNDGVVGITASVLESGKIKFSNNDGAVISMGANSATVLGIAVDMYAGFVELTHADGKDISIEVGSKANGYGASAAGKALDLQDLGFNEIGTNSGGLYTVKGAGPVDGTVLQKTDGLKINGVEIDRLDSQSSTSIHATDKVAAINAKTGETGVTATGYNQIKVTVDLNGSTKANHDGVKIDGVTIDLSTTVSMDVMVTNINAALAGTSSTVASLDADSGFLLLTNETGGTISFDDSDDGTGQGDLFKAATYVDGTAATTAYTGGLVTARGFINLSSNGNAPIKIEDGYADGDSTATGMTGAARIGFESQNELSNGTSTGVNVSTVIAANASIESIDKAIETISSFRAGFGAYENRLDASINNLTTLQINTDAARSRIEDADFAQETTNMTKSQILSQAATSMLAQANSSKQNLLALLQG